MLVIGITGGVGAGKSSVLKVLEEHCYCRMILADDVGNKVKEPGQHCYMDLVHLLGTEVLNEDGTINKIKMAERIFSDKDLLDRVNAIIHPAVEDYILGEIQKERELQKIDVFFLEAALLIEAGYVPHLDEVWYIYSNENVRRKRLKESRAYSDKKIDQIMKSQLSDEQFRQYASVVLDNSNSFEETFEQIKAACIEKNIWLERDAKR